MVVLWLVWLLAALKIRRSKKHIESTACKAAVGQEDIEILDFRTVL